MVQETMEKFGNIDILVNNAGITRAGYFVETTEEDWDTVFDVNIKGVFLCSEYVAPHMMKQKKDKIINISSGIKALSAARKGGGRRVAYASTEWAVMGSTKRLTRELGPYNININVIYP